MSYSTANSAASDNLLGRFGYSRIARFIGVTPARSILRAGVVYTSSRVISAGAAAIAAWNFLGQGAKADNALPDFFKWLPSMAVSGIGFGINMVLYWNSLAKLLDTGPSIIKSYRTRTWVHNILYALSVLVPLASIPSAFIVPLVGVTASTFDYVNAGFASASMALVGVRFANGLMKQYVIPFLEKWYVSSAQRLGKVFDKNDLPYLEHQRTQLENTLNHMLCYAQSNADFRKALLQMLRDENVTLDGVLKLGQEQLPKHERLGSVLKFITGFAALSGLTLTFGILPVYYAALDTVGSALSILGASPYFFMFYLQWIESLHGVARFLYSFSVKENPSFVSSFRGNPLFYIPAMFGISVATFISICVYTFLVTPAEMKGTWFGEHMGSFVQAMAAVDAFWGNGGALIELMFKLNSIAEVDLARSGESYEAQVRLNEMKGKIHKLDNQVIDCLRGNKALFFQDEEERAAEVKSAFMPNLVA